MLHLHGDTTHSMRILIGVLRTLQVHVRPVKCEKNPECNVDMLRSGGADLTCLRKVRRPTKQAMNSTPNLANHQGDLESILTVLLDSPERTKEASLLREFEEVSTHVTSVESGTYKATFWSHDLNGLRLTTDGWSLACDDGLLQGRRIISW